MRESLRIDSPFMGAGMPKAYSRDLRERVITAVETGASRREAAERFVKWQREPSQALTAPSAPSSHSSVLKNVPTISGMQAMFQYDRNPL
jgi:hypothetical protein